MAMIPVHFEYLTGLRCPIFTSARLTGSWDDQGRCCPHWSAVPMEPFIAEDGCPAFRATVLLDDGQINQAFRWGVIADTPRQTGLWAIPTEITDPASDDRSRSFILYRSGHTQRFWLTHCRRLGANKLFVNGARLPAIRFAAWAPNARNVELILADPASGYVFDDGRGVTATCPMFRDHFGVWSTDPIDSPALSEFAAFERAAYMFRIEKDDGSVACRTDILSRCQIGQGDVDPARNPARSGAPHDLDPAGCCSVVVDPEGVVTSFSGSDRPASPDLPEEAFWRDEFDPARPLPDRIADLVIHDLHIDGARFGHNRQHQRSTLGEAIGLLDRLAARGVNAIELMPLSRFEAWAGCGKGTSHRMAVQFAGEGRDRLKHFVRACHRRGIAVLLEVNYACFSPGAERAEWLYDSNDHGRSIYYWYEGVPGDYPHAHPPGHGGYIENGSAGYAPRLWDEMVRKLLISSAAMLVSEFHIDGFRVDQTAALHSHAVVRADGRRIETVNLFGAKFLREWTRTLRLIKPGIFLIADDRSGWPRVTEPTDAGGLGFDAE